MATTASASLLNAVVARSLHMVGRAGRCSAVAPRSSDVARTDLERAMLRQ